MKFLHFCILLFLFGCGNKEIKLDSLESLKGGKTFAVPTGTVADQFVIEKYPDAKIEYYNSVLDCALAVRDGKADAVAYDKPILQNIAAKYDGLILIARLLFDDQYGFAVQLQNKALKQAMDEVLAELKANGTYDDMQKRWFPEKGDPAPMPEIKAGEENGVLKFGTAAVTEPMSFVDGHQQIVGFDIEYATYIARKTGKKLEIVNMEFGAMLPALISGKVDMIGAGLSITPERAKKVLFSQSYYPSGIAVAVRSVGKGVPNENGANLKNVDDLADKTIGIYTGTIFDGFLTKKYPKAEISRYETTADLIMSVKTGKVDAAMMDLKTATIAVKHNPQLGILTDTILTMPLGFGFRKQNTLLRDQFNAFLATIREDGTYQTVYRRWFVEDPEKARMPLFRIPGHGKTLVAGVAVNDLPYVALMNGKYVGFDIELIQRFAEHENYHLEFMTLEFSSLVAALAAGKVDMIADGIAISAERQKQIDFSDSYAEIKSAVIALNKNMGIQDAREHEYADKSFIASLSDSFYNNIIHEKRYLHILDGLKVTLLISILAALFGTLVGGLICYLRMSKNNLLSTLAKLYISLLRGTPVLVLLMIIYYVVFASVNINPIVVAVFAFGLNFGAYVSEIFRTSVESIDKGQKEAAIAGGFNKVQTFSYIILPQALRHILPVYKGEFISLIKMTSIVGYIAVQDLTKASDIIRSRTFDAFFPLIMVAVLYLLIAWFFTWLLGLVEFSADPRSKRAKKMEVSR